MVGLVTIARIYLNTNVSGLGSKQVTIRIVIPGSNHGSVKN
jgi:hypothetical protein